MCAVMLSRSLFRVLEVEMRTSFEDESRVHGSSDVDGSASHVERRCGAQGGGGRACRWLLCQDCFVPPVDGAGGGLKRGVDGGCTPCRVLLFDEGDHAGYVWCCHARPRYHCKSFPCNGVRVLDLRRIREQWSS